MTLLSPLAYATAKGEIRATLPWLFAANGIFVAMILWRRHKYGPKFPDRKTVKIVFEETFASGRSMRNFMTMIGGTSRGLKITVTEEELWVRPFFPFGIFGYVYDLEHRIPLADVTAIESGRRSVAVHFRRQREKDVPGHLVLQVWNAPALIQAMSAGRGMERKDGEGEGAGDSPGPRWSSPG